MTQDIPVPEAYDIASNEIEFQKINALLGKPVDLERVWQAIDDMVSALSGQVEEAIFDRDVYKDEAKEAEDALKEAEHENEDLTKENNTLTDKVSCLEDEVEQLEAQNKKMRNRLIELGDEVDF